MKHYSLGATLSKGEVIGGVCYLPFYFVLLSVLLTLVYGVIGLELTEVNLNLGYFYINFIAVMLIFHRFLAASLRNIPKNVWMFLQALILGFALYYVGNLLVGLLLAAIDPGLMNPNDDTTTALAAANFRMMLVCAVFLGPVVEEILVRGLVFGSIQPKSRIAAYAVSCLLFSAIHLWQYVPTTPVLTLLLDVLQYIPAGIALGWTYEKSGNIWAPVVLHAAINAMTLGILQLGV